MEIPSSQPIFALFELGQELVFQIQSKGSGRSNDVYFPPPCGGSDCGSCLETDARECDGWSVEQIADPRKSSKACLKVLFGAVKAIEMYLFNVGISREKKDPRWNHLECRLLVRLVTEAVPNQASKQR